MSKQKFLIYINRLVEKNVNSKTVLAEKAKISRVTFYKLLSGEIEEARLSTFINLAYALDVHPVELIRRYFSVDTDTAQQSTAQQSTALSVVEPEIVIKKRRKKMNGASFVNDLSCPDNTRVQAHEVFEKTWLVTNTGDLPWQGVYLHCIDNLPRNLGLPIGLNPKQLSVPVPNTAVGETVSISVTFTAPSIPGCVISYWKLMDEQGNSLDNYLFHCLVQVISL